MYLILCRPTPGSNQFAVPSLEHMSPLISLEHMSPLILDFFSTLCSIIYQKFSHFGGFLGINKANSLHKSYVFVRASFDPHWDSVPPTHMSHPHGAPLPHSRIWVDNPALRFGTFRVIFILFFLLSEFLSIFLILFLFICKKIENKFVDKLNLGKTFSKLKIF